MIVEDIFTQLGADHQRLLREGVKPFISTHATMTDHTLAYSKKMVAKSPHNIGKMLVIDEEIALMAVSKLPQALAMIPAEWQTPRVCREALAKAAGAAAKQHVMESIKNWTPEVFMYLYRMDPTYMLRNFPLGVFDNSPLKIYIAKN